MNKKIRTIIVDDTPTASAKLEHDLKFFPDIEVIECINSPNVAVKSIVKQQPDLLFLDIEMPGMSGLELLNHIQDDIKEMRVVFYTAHNQYLIDAVRTSAFDYLQKPYLPEELSFIVNRLLADNGSKDSFSQSFQQFVKKDDKFAIQSITGLMFVRCEEVVLFHYLKEQRCWAMKQTNNITYKLRTNLGSKELLSLSPSFVQINQQCIINSNYLFSIENKTLKCILCPPFSDIGEVVSSRYYKKIKDNLNIL